MLSPAAVTSSPRLSVRSEGKESESDPDDSVRRSEASLVSASYLKRGVEDNIEHTVVVE